MLSLMLGRDILPEEVDVEGIPLLIKAAEDLLVDNPWLFKPMRADEGDYEYEIRPGILNTARSLRTKLNVTCKSLIAQGDVVPSYIHKMTQLIEQLDLIDPEMGAYYVDFLPLAQAPLDVLLMGSNVTLKGFWAGRAVSGKQEFSEKQVTSLDDSWKIEKDRPLTVTDILHVQFLVRDKVEQLDLGWVMADFTNDQLRRLAHKNDLRIEEGNKIAQGLLWRMYQAAEIARMEVLKKGIVDISRRVVKGQLTIIADVNWPNGNPKFREPDIAFGDFDVSRSVDEAVLEEAKARIIDDVDCSTRWLINMIMREVDEKEHRDVRGGREGLCPAEFIRPKQKTPGF